MSGRVIRAARSNSRGFTVVEILIIVVIVAVLATIGIMTFLGMQRRSVDMLVTRTIADAQKNLQTFQVFNKFYPSNIANTDYTPPVSVGMVLYTDAPQTPVYSGLTSEQNAQLFLNACNGYMPITSGGTTYNTSCTYAGVNEHIAGTGATNVVIHGPTINQADFQLICGPACDTAQSNIIATFIAQGGVFPVSVPKSGSALPAPSMVTTGKATTYCLEVRSPDFIDIIYHATPGTQPIPGACSTAGLHYP